MAYTLEQYQEDHPKFQSPEWYDYWEEREAYEEFKEDEARENSKDPLLNLKKSDNKYREE